VGQYGGVDSNAPLWAAVFAGALGTMGGALGVAWRLGRLSERVEGLRDDLMELRAQMAQRRG